MMMEEMGEIAHAREEVVQSVDFNETALSKLLDALDKLTKIQDMQKCIADALEIVPEAEDENTLDRTFTFPLKGLQEFRDLERMCTNDTYRRNLTKSLRKLLTSGPSQDPIKNLLDDSIVMHFSWDDPTAEFVISLRHTLSFGHVIYNALGMGFADYATFVQGCLQEAQAKYQNFDISNSNPIRTDTQLQHFTHVVSDISQRISDLEIFQKTIGSFACLKKHEIDPKIYFPISSMKTLKALEEVLQFKVIQSVVISHCKELYKKCRTLKNILTESFLAEFSMNGSHSSVDLFSFKFFNHVLFMAMEMSQEDYQAEIMYFIQAASENLSGNIDKVDQEASAVGKKLVTHKKIMLINKKDLTQQGIPKKFMDILRDKGKTTIFTDNTNFISLSKLDTLVKEEETKKASLPEDLQERFSRYFPLTSQKTLREINIKLTDKHFKAVLQTTLDDFYQNRKFSIKDILSDEFLVKVDEDTLFTSYLMNDFIPLILSLHSKSFVKMAKSELRALKGAFELRDRNHSDFLKLEVAFGQTIPSSEDDSDKDKRIFPIASIEDFDNLEKNLQYSEFHKEISNTCRIILMKTKKFKLTDFLKEEILLKYSAKGTATTLSLMETKLFGDILQKFSKLEEAQFITSLQKHHCIALKIMKNNQAAEQKTAEKTTNVVPVDDQESKECPQQNQEESKKKKRKYVEIIFPLETQEELSLVNEKLQDQRFRQEIEKVLKELLYESSDGIPLESLLAESLLSKYTWDDEPKTSLKQYLLFSDVIFNILKIEWSTYDQLMQKSLHRTVMKSREIEMRMSPEVPMQTNDFIIIALSPPSKISRDESTILQDEEVIYETPQASQEQELVAIEDSIPAPSAPANEDLEQDLQNRHHDATDDNSNLNDFEYVLPIKTKEEFFQLECLLAEKNFSNYFSHLCNSCSDVTSLLSYIITNDALRHFSWNGCENTLKFYGTNLCNLLLSKNTSINSLQAIIDSVREDISGKDKNVITLFPITSEADLRTVESYLPNFKSKMVTDLTELRQSFGNEVFSKIFSQEFLKNSSKSELENLSKSTFFKEVIQEVFKDMKKTQILTIINGDLFETPDKFFAKILPVNEMNLSQFEHKLKRKKYANSLIKICKKLMQTHDDGYFLKLIDGDLIQQYKFNKSDEGSRSIEKTMLYNKVFRELYKKSEEELQEEVQMQLYRAQALADYKSDKLQS